MVGWRHRKEARDGLLPNRLASDKHCEAWKSPGAAEDALGEMVPPPTGALVSGIAVCL